MPPKAEWAKEPCRECGLPLGDKYMTTNGTLSGAQHYLAGSVKDGCMYALRKEVVRLRDQVDYLTDLVETPSTPILEGDDIESVNPTFGQVRVNGKWHELRVKRDGTVVAEEAR
jgi:hypothetical protein